MTKPSSPSNTNLFQSNKFEIVIPSLRGTSFFAQSTVIPGVSTQNIKVQTPLNKIVSHGEKLNYNPFSLSFLVDEDLDSFRLFLNWFKSYTKPQSHSQYWRSPESIVEKSSPYKDIKIILNKNSHNQNLIMTVYNAVPSNMTDIYLSSMNTADQTPTFDVTFDYDYYDIDLT